MVSVLDFYNGMVLVFDCDTIPRYGIPSRGIGMAIFPRYRTMGQPTYNYTPFSAITAYLAYRIAAISSNTRALINNMS